MRIVIIGAGAIGSTLGALLSRRGQDVTLIGRPAHLTAIRRNGLRVDGYLGEFTVPIAIVEALDFQPDLALLTVKTQDVITAIQDNLTYLNDVPLVTLQNGVRSDDLVAGFLPRRQIISAVVRLSANYLAPGKITVLERGLLVIGRPFGSNDTQVDQIARILNQAVPTFTSRNIRGAHWLKLLINLNNALPALTNCTMSQVSADPYLSRLGVRLMREGLDVIARAGIRLEGLPQMPAGLIRLMGSLPVAMSARMFAGMTRRMKKNGPLLGSTLQSLRRGRSTEIDYLNGEVVQLGKKVGMPTPLNATVVEFVHRVEQTGQFLSVDVIQDSLGRIP